MTLNTFLRRDLPANGGDALLSRVRPRQLTHAEHNPAHDGPHGLCFSGVSEPFHKGDNSRG